MGEVIYLDSEDYRIYADMLDQDLCDDDIDMVRLINQLSCKDEDMYMIGMCFHDAQITKQQIKLGLDVSASRLNELEAVIEALQRNNLKTYLTGD